MSKTMTKRVSDPTTIFSRIVELMNKMHKVGVPTTTHPATVPMALALNDRAWGASTRAFVFAFPSLSWC